MLFSVVTGVDKGGQGGRESKVLCSSVSCSFDRFLMSFWAVLL